MSADGSDPEPLTADDGGHDVIASGTGAANISNNDTFESLGPQAWGP